MNTKFMPLITWPNIPFIVCFTSVCRNDRGALTVAEGIVQEWHWSRRALGKVATQDVRRLMWYAHRYAVKSESRQKKLVKKWRR